jgi:hypothetical protein
MIKIGFNLAFSKKEHTRRSPHLCRHYYHFLLTADIN